MASLADELAKLANPNPSVDPEDDMFEDTRAKLVEKDDLIYDGELNNGVGSKRMQSLEGMGVQYQGMVVSRNDVMQDAQFSSDDEYKLSTELENNKPFGSSGDVNSNENSPISEDENEEGKLMLNEESDEEIDSDEAMGDENLEIFKHQADHDPNSKGLATRNQICLWENMLELRIKCQKMLTISNQLPQCDTMNTFKEQLEKSLTETDAGFNNLLYKLIKLETSLLKQIPQASEEIGSNGSCSVKRKSSSSLEELDSAVEERFVNTRRHRNKILKLWYDKTRLTSSTPGNSNLKSFSNFERSTISQIEDILKDKERLIKRTELQRSEYRILGTVVSKQDEKTEITEHSGHLKKFNEEIFDDDDFYHQLLRQFIEQKASTPGGASDPLELTRQWLKVQRLRTKMHKNVDTKASKGRKIRYEIHQKLVSFMAPHDQSTFSHDSRNQLFRSLFGKVMDEDPEN